MFPKKKEDLSKNQIVDFTPPRIHTGKTCYVSFSQTDPATGKLRQKRYMLNKFRPGKERDVAAARIISNIYNMVGKGWNVWAPQITTRGNTLLSVVLDRYALYLTIVQKKNVMKQKTFYDYTSRLKILREYISEMVEPVRCCFQLDQTFFVDFLDYLLIDRDLSPKTRNNYRTWCSTLCTWMVEKKYLEENPMQYIHQLPEYDKFRQPLDKDDLHKLGVYLESCDKPFLLAVMMEYFTAIRPTELSFIRLSDINISEGSIFVSSQISKNRRDGKIKLPNRVIRLMIDLHVFDYPNDFFLFSTGFRPGKQRQNPRHFTYSFNKCREALGFPSCYQFYSLKDSGLRDIANSVGVEVAQKQARHSDISTTNQYLKGKGMAVFDVLADFEGYL